MPATAPAALAAALAAASWALAGCAPLPEGRLAVDSVRIAHAGPIDEGDLLGKLATTASPKFLGLFEGVVYDYTVFRPATLQRDLARVERYYRGHGFLEAHARAGRVIPTGGRHVRVEIVVDVGTPTLNRDLTIRGIDNLPVPVANAVRRATRRRLAPDERFDQGAYEQAKDALQRALTDRGYAYAGVEAEARVDLAAHAVDYTFAVHPGPRAVFGDVTIVGLHAGGQAAVGARDLAPGPLRRVMNLDPGERYSTAAIDAATQALLDLDVFSAVQIVPELGVPPSTTVPLTVRVEPAKLHALDLGGGFEVDDIKTDVHALVGWEDHDFLGGLRHLSIELRTGAVLYPTRADNLVAPAHLLPEERLRFQFRQPGFVEPRTSLYLRPELNVYPLLVEASPPPDQPVVGYVEPKGAIGLERRFGGHLFGSVGFNLQGEVPFAYLDPLSEPLPSILLSYPQLTTTLDLRDNPVHPHAGFYASNDLQWQVPGLGSTAHDVRIQPEIRGYVPLARGITLAARGSLGLLLWTNYGDTVRGDIALASSQGPAAGGSAGAQRATEALDRDIELIYFRGFFSGGPNSNRGYPLRGIAPYAAVPFLNPATARAQVANGCQPGGPNVGTSGCETPIGGFTLWEASAEVRFDVSGPLGVALFCDSGDVSAGAVDVRLDHLHLSCGVGGRYDTPVGPIRLDVGARIPGLQVLGQPGEDPALGRLPTVLGVPIAVAFGIGEPF